MWASTFWAFANFTHRKHEAVKIKGNLRPHHLSPFYPDPKQYYNNQNPQPPQNKFQVIRTVKHFLHESGCIRCLSPCTVWVNLTEKKTNKDCTVIWEMWSWIFKLVIQLYIIMLILIIIITIRSMFIHFIHLNILHFCSVPILLQNEISAVASCWCTLSFNKKLIVNA